MKRIGIGFTGNHDSIDTYVEGAEYAESNGFDSVWFAEDYFLRDTMSTQSVVAHETDAIDIGLFFNAYTRNPALTAMSVAAVDEIADGRVKVAMGAGVPSTLERILEFTNPLETIPEAVDVIRRLLDEDSVTHEGRHFGLEGTTLGHCPYLSYGGEFHAPRSEVPIHIAAIGPQMLKMAGDVGDGLVVSFGVPPLLVEQELEHVAGGLEMSGRTLDEFEVVAYIVTAPQINSRVREFAAEMIALAEPLLHLDVRDVGISLADAEEIREVHETEGVERAAELTTDEMVKTFAIVGDEASCHDRLDEYVAAGVDIPVLFHLGPEDPERIVDIGASWL